MKIELSQENIKDLESYLITTKTCSKYFDEKEVQIAKSSLYFLKCLENTELRVLEKQAYIAIANRDKEIKQEKARAAYFIMLNGLRKISGCEYGCDHCDNKCETSKKLYKIFRNT